MRRAHAIPCSPRDYAGHSCMFGKPPVWKTKQPLRNPSQMERLYRIDAAKAEQTRKLLAEAEEERRKEAAKAKFAAKQQKHQSKFDKFKEKSKVKPSGAFGGKLAENKIQAMASDFAQGGPILSAKPRIVGEPSS